MPIKLTHRASIRQTGNNRRGIPPRVREALKADLEAYGQLHVGNRMTFVAPWHGSEHIDRFKPPSMKRGSAKPRFFATVDDDGEVIKLRITITGSSYAKLKYRWVSGGTNRRYATMTPGWESKTSWRTIDSGPGGEGWVAFVDRKQPKGAIEAREIDEHLQETLEPPFLAMIRAKYKFPMTITSRAGVTRG